MIAEVQSKVVNWHERAFETSQKMIFEFIDHVCEKHADMVSSGLEDVSFAENVEEMTNMYGYLTSKYLE